MYMRYYPKQVRSSRKVFNDVSDRGKKHYWSIDRGDYGFYQSQDKASMKNKRKSIYHKPIYTINKTTNPQRITEMIEDSKKIEQSFRDKVSAFNKHEQINNSQDSGNSNIFRRTPKFQKLSKDKEHIGKICTKKNRDISDLKHQRDIFLPKLSSKQIVEQNMKSSDYYQASLQDSKDHQQFNQVVNKRVKTQNIYTNTYDEQKWQDPRFRSYRSHHKYSPTFTSSLDNPLPSPYIRTPSKYQTHQYQLLKT